ncbi:protein-(glutamine-N5) methyltransferase, release factor-specific [Vibrio mediterranei]|uniref:Release factor glutamine methyltransferase n=1 Tax=Vibrio mediterranei TaxID=689 RepID=A0ABX5DIW5_9VIBR|nr:peptide chain release factor N(5)-glutamine methyltransferase [Vibrio mediterranei]PCD90288.1 protein-(glutamine-N5) methyltransferase, release factor-specific [Vibrio mediterranei]PRQ69674.1 protein-(glutamine-N5) methyltransferase, release factor-specific [Vibrio mediterranei]
MSLDMSIEAVLKRASLILSGSGSESPSLDAAVLLCHVLEKPRSYLLTWPEKALTSNEAEQFEALLNRRIAGEPVAYILGEREFWSLPLNVAPSTLIPRPDTERLVELALDKALVNDGDILDLGTGTGAIALALASELKTRSVMGVDFQTEAVELARSNATKLNITNCQFAQGSWFEPVDLVHKFSVIVSNPPYIDENDPHLSQGDVRFEPSTALVAENNGLADIETITAKAPTHLLEGGWLLFEHGFEQGQAVREILENNGFCHVVTEQDYAGNDRVTLGQWNP